VCGYSDQAAHYHNLSPKLGASLLTWHIGWKNRKKKEKRKFLLMNTFPWFFCFQSFNSEFMYIMNNKGDKLHPWRTP
jgi:hypothetical protein